MHLQALCLPQSLLLVKTKEGGDLPDGAVVKNLPCNAKDAGLIPSWGANIPHGLRPDTVKKKKKTKEGR